MPSLQLGQEKAFYRIRQSTQRSLPRQTHGFLWYVRRAAWTAPDFIGLSTMTAAESVMLLSDIATTETFSDESVTGTGIQIAAGRSTAVRRRHVARGVTILVVVIVKMLDWREVISVLMKVMCVLIGIVEYLCLPQASLRR